MNYRNCFKALVVSFAVAALTAFPAQAGTRPNDRALLGAGSQRVEADKSDVVSRYLRSHSTSHNRAPSRAVEAAAASMPDAFERYAAAHPYGIGLSPTTLATSDGFHWGEYGAGIGTGIGVVFVLLAGLYARPIRRRQQAQPAIGRGVG